MKTQQLELELVIEKADDGQIWGRVNYEDSLVVDVAISISELEDQIRQLLKRQHQVNPDRISFFHTFDLQTFFEQYSFLKISDIASLSGINAGLVRQYASGVKNPSANQIKKIEDTVHRLGQQMQQLKLVAG
ncbi:MAG TPA: hypothetical protein VNI52_01845 [Sphingobacteriaceae bacterium]|nr:hypothetical protein [Sphingobacteriaceae bacterium]